MVSENYEARGQTLSRARDCECRKAKIREARFLRAVELTPRKYRQQHGVFDGLRQITPDAGVHPKQPETLKLLAANPHKSFYLWGRAGTHKTTMAWGLIQEAGRAGKLVGGNSGRTLIETLRDFMFDRKVPRDDVFYDLGVLEKKPGEYCLLIDDIDVIKLSEWTGSLLTDLLDKVLNYEQQLIVTSNLSIDALVKDWVRRDFDGRANAVNYSEKIIRRLKEICIDIELI